ncbi:PHD finger protein 14 isoform X2 [Coccinella septempunctata]|uniref:PHD finger protein 14 isoform X2 n=1 Tax=Coccinella septempunctata TaxID=41139 RepID=UPI001D081DA0|nr:PHD finger protein 14 isoform X2 [Coccinella septempunctata]
MSLERDPKKRRVKPVDTQAIIKFEDLEESSDDSDFRIEDHPEVTDDDDDSLDSGGNDDSSSEEEEESDVNEELKALEYSKDDGFTVSDLLSEADFQSDKYSQLADKYSEILICFGCLGDHSDSVNEIVECDSCGVTVHEACYGVSDSASLSSTDSLSPTAPWFCEACKAGVKNPVCELCPNTGGIFKETDVGKWVHLVCALYVPGVAFGEVDKLTNVTLFEMPYSKWGAKSCSLCTDERFARTGVCIGCDAGMCRTYFHVTCAQREGFLSEAHSEEVDQADPFYAHCKLHSDKTLVKKRKKNYLALQLRTHCRFMQFQKEGHSTSAEQLRIKRKLERQKVHYSNQKSLKPPPWVPTQKMPRLLTTSASACKRLLKKAQLMGIDTLALEMQDAQIAALQDIRKKWHISPAFSVEFIAYYMDRNDRLKGMKETLEKLLEENKVLLEEQQILRTKYDELLKNSAETTKKEKDLKQAIHKFHSAILSASPTKNLPNIENLGKPVITRPTQPMMVPTAAALKMGVGFPLNNMAPGRTDRVLSSHARQDPLLLNECATCRQRRDQHLLAKCDTCSLYYHLDCLNPPLSRLPKKSKLYGWQCSECDKSSDSEVEEMKTPRRIKSRYSREGRSDPESLTPIIKIKPLELCNPKIVIRSLSSDENLADAKVVIQAVNDDGPGDSGLELINTPDNISVINGNEGHKSGKKRRREKHRSRYSPDLGSSGKEHKRKRKKKSIDIDEMPHPRITIKIKPIPLPDGEVPSESNPQRFYVPQENGDEGPPALPPKAETKTRSPRTSISKPPLEPPKILNKAEKKSSENRCHVCAEEAVSNESVKCDECLNLYHFVCLDPPLKKTPKRRGYSWHCADCDPTGSE